MTAVPGNIPPKAGLPGEQLFLPPPSTVLMPPHRAPEAMLAQVEVDPDGWKLRSEAEGIGTIELEVFHWDASQGTDAEETRARLASPLSELEAEPETLADAPLSTKHPYAVIPNHAAYAVALHAPRDAIDTEWSEPHDVPSLSKIASSWMLTQLFPELAGRGLTGDYRVEVQQQVLRGLAMAVRLDNGEPQIRQQVLQGLSMQYHEMMAVFRDHPDFPDTATAVVHARVTHKEPKPDKTHDIDVQPWEFVLPDGFQKTDTDGKSGQVEVIVFRTTRVRYGPLTLEPYTPPVLPSYRGGGFGDFGGDTYKMMGPTRGGSLSAGETRYRKPETFPGREVPTVKEATAIAAFRIALLGVSQQ